MKVEDKEKVANEENGGNRWREGKECKLGSDGSHERDGM